MYNLKAFAILTFVLLSFGLARAKNIEPKKGYVNIYIGMTTAELVNIMGSPSDIVSMEDETKDWVDAGYKLESKVVFHIGFDRVYKYTQDNEYGLWKAYIKDDKVVYMSITTYSALSESVDQISIADKIKFGASVQEVISHMGEGYHRKIDERNYTELIYMNKGIRFIFIDDELNHVYVFAPMSKSEEYRYLQNF